MAQWAHEAAHAQDQFAATGYRILRSFERHKTARSSYPEHEVTLADQLIAYQLTEPNAAQVALCVFVRTKEPRIVWYVSARQPTDLAEYLA